jgi:hypothetical protein
VSSPRSWLRTGQDLQMVSDEARGCDRTAEFMRKFGILLRPDKKRIPHQLSPPSSSHMPYISVAHWSPKVVRHGYWKVTPGVQQRASRPRPDPNIINSTTPIPIDSKELILKLLCDPHWIFQPQLSPDFQGFPRPT